jgi:hypothetical protein
MHARGRTAFGANTPLLVAGIGSMVVAGVGLFVRASPTLSGFFLVVGAVLLVMSVFVPRRNDAGSSDAQQVDVALLERSARTAEADVAHGQVYALDVAPADGDGSSNSEDATAVQAFVSSRTAKMLQRADGETADALRQELHAIPMLEDTSRLAPIEGVMAGYRSLTLPSGYMAVYRRLTPVEVKQATGAYTEHDSYLVANLVPLIHS